MGDLAAYASLFAVAFSAATVLPAQSEAVLAGLLLTGRHSLGYLIVIASVGNVLGSTVNWLLGRGIERLRDRPWFPAGPAALERARRRYRRYGKWSLLLSWVPFIGDPLTVIAGALREPLATFLLLVTIAKVTRYLVLTAIVLHWH
jgi:membrane protein YqaA with SNARE-associated domain